MNAITPDTAAASDTLAEFGPTLYPAAMICAPGIYDDVTHDEYHSQSRLLWPALTCSIAKALVGKTPRHAWQMHPRFGNVGMVPTAVMDDGAAMHAMMLGHAHLIEPIRAVYGPKVKDKDRIGRPVTDYKTSEAQDERDEIRGMGKIPVLAHRLPELLRCKHAAWVQLNDAEDGAVFLSPGRSEVCAVAREDDVVLQCLVDRLPDDPLAPGDLKCTELSAAPGGWERRLQREYAFQDAFYRRVLRGAEGFERPAMRFGVIELEPPHGTVVMAPLPELVALAEVEVDRAIQLWRHCTRSNEWPSYGPKTVWIGPTPWQITRAEDDEQINDAAIEQFVGAAANWNAVKALRAA